MRIQSGGPLPVYVSFIVSGRRYFSSMEREYEKRLGTALVAIGLALLLFGFFQAYTFIQHPPSGTYDIFNLGGGGPSGSGTNVSGTFNGIFLVTFMFLTIEYLVGASILKAGWNLITPKAETIQVRVKPRSLQVEPVSPEAPTSAAAPAAPSLSAPGASSGPVLPVPPRVVVNASAWAEDSHPPAT